MRILEEFVLQVLAYSPAAMREIDSRSNISVIRRQKIRKYGKAIEFLTIRDAARFAFSDVSVQRSDTA
ncbi:hypothetical protein SG18_01770 [Pandoraea apista]|nr:hypothetical protein SG18_01770 [Pandoraea apista]AKH71171.1 hypothetical protein XM39_01770 [Pandoraea apista]AKI63442.1 hypothetical protein AA956_19090 [Pandoraea apista]ALS67449.1 hypothetical protein AT395_23090 [Pandoraea apista]RRW95971.1 hypothetical protein EGJ54_12645 [Pandoraea apista]